MKSEYRRPGLNSNPLVESIKPEWVKDLSLGIGKNFSFYKSIQCYSLLQYNMLHSRQETTYTQAFQAKIGFYISGKHLMRKKREENSE